MRDVTAADLDPNTYVIPWTKCDMCDDFVCNVHGGLHVAECICPDIETWIDYELSPYDVCKRRDIRGMLEREKLVAKTN